MLLLANCGCHTIALIATDTITSYHSPRCDNRRYMLVMVMINRILRLGYNNGRLVFRCTLLEVVLDHVVEFCLGFF